MSIQINNNFDYKGNQPNFERDRFETLELMRSADERSLDNGHISYCEETGKHYVFNENNDIDVETGKWRLLIENPENLDTNKQDKTDNALDTTDKTVVGAINEINGNALDNVTFSADYKNIIINRKNGLNPYTIPIASIINNAKIIELNDVDSTDIGNGKTLVYDGATQKHKYVDSTGTDELVKMDSTTDAKYLSDLIDKSTVVNDNGVLKVKKLDGQEVTIAEINHLKGLTMNVMDLVNAFANGGVKVYERTIPTYADLLALDRSGFIDGIKYFVYVQSDETHDGAKTTYICDKNSTSYFCVSGDHRDFTTNPIDLANEVTGKLGTSNIDVDALWKLLTINDTYKTLTTKNEPFGTHGAKALYDELVANIGKKANATDLTSHTSDTNIHVTTSDKTKWNKVDNKVDKNTFIRLNNLPNGSYCAISSFSKGDNEFIALDIVKYDGTVNRLELTNEGNFINHINYDGSKWKRIGRVCITNVANVKTTNIKPTFPSTVTLGTTQIISYSVKNGWANVSIVMQLKASPKLGWTSIATGLPKTDKEIHSVSYGETGINNNRVAFRLKVTGALEILISSEITQTDWWNVNFSYPVVEP